MVSAAFSAGDCQKKRWFKVIACTTLFPENRAVPFTPKEEKNMQEVTIAIKGMHCKSCQKLIQDSLLEMDGVEKAQVDLVKEQATVVFDKSKASLNSIKAEIKKLGYSTDSQTPKEKISIKQGLAYGLVPHIGCIGFIAASILGATVAVEFFKPLLMNPWIFHFLVLISIGFATLSSAIYLRKNGFFSLAGLKRKKKYLGTMYGSTVGINLVLFLAVFPMLANLDTGSFADIPTGAAALGSDSQPLADSIVKLKVNIPCPGHAPLISDELKTIQGVTGVRYQFPDVFEVAFNSEKASKQEILGLEVFEIYPATLEGETLVENSGETASFEEIKETAPLQQTNTGSYSCNGGCSGSCGGGCSVCSSR
jgi:copper chaperone CopZ